MIKRAYPEKRNHRTGSGPPDLRRTPRGPTFTQSPMAVSITPLQIDLTHRGLIDPLREWLC